ncbi:MAG TPA: LPS export ABC transporter periplasmic protein LptC [Candidatus Marinimicrobia bacterium]|nr:LPS export ABC transporter periplasmic protein LptC [Candidatus Neomarinimicrobiota bacterium]
MKRLIWYCTILVFLLGCQSSEENVIESEERVYPDQESWNTTIMLTKNGQKRALVLAGHLTKNNNEALIMMDDSVDVDFFNAEQSHLSHLTAQQAQVNENTNDLLASGNVVVVSDSGVTLYTEELRWDHQRERIVSEVFITFVQDQDTLTGIGFESDSDLKNWIIRKPSGVTERKIKE